MPRFITLEDGTRATIKYENDERALYFITITASGSQSRRLIDMRHSSLTSWL